MSDVTATTGSPEGAIGGQPSDNNSSPTSQPSREKVMREYFAKIGQKGGKSKSPKKRSTSQSNLAKARLNRWRKSL